MKRMDFLGGEYYITKQGDIFTKTKGNLKLFKQQFCGKGYRCVRLLGTDGKQKSFRVARLVVQTFIGEIPKNMQVDHIDGNKTNNNISNLRIVTNSDNQLNKFAHLKAKKLKRICEHCLKDYVITNYMQKYCSSYCLKRSWRLAFKNRTGVWE